MSFSLAFNLEELAMSSQETFSPVSSTTPTPEPLSDITIDGVLQELEVWRSTKAQHRQPSYPDELWRRILWLGQQHGGTKIRSVLGIGSDQYKNKAAQFASKASKKDDQAVPFVEIATPSVDASSKVVATDAPITASPSRSVYQPAEMTVPEASAVTVVEVCRADGVVMKIYTVKEHWPALLDAFVAGGAS
jgi:hypothetical protein